MGSESKQSTGASTPGTAPRTAQEEEVAGYLREHPDFFSRRPEVLARLVIPHDCGQAASLIEHQVRVLQKESTELRMKFRELMDNAHLNEELSQRIHRLVLALVQARELDECLAALYQGMSGHFGADMISLRIFARAREVHDQGLGEFVTDNDCDLFQSVFGGGQPVCGQATSAQLEFLFHDQASAVGSTALVPVQIGYEPGGKDPGGAQALLAIGSRDAGRFQPGMGTVYLRQLAEILGQILRRYVM